MDNRDKDYRYMACSDLNTELQKVGVPAYQLPRAGLAHGLTAPPLSSCLTAPPRSPVLIPLFSSPPQETYQLGPDDEHRMCDAVMKALGDSATDVQGVAVKW
jgi:hypothetical protein